MTKLVLDPDNTRVRVRIFAEGLFARFAHDLELECSGLRGTAERAGEDEGSATLEVPIARIDVAGTLKAGRVDRRGLSSSDREECLGKMRKDVFHACDGLVRVEANLEACKARVRVVPPNGCVVERSITVRLEPGAAETLRVCGTLALSLTAIGSSNVKGPMNAFRVKDVVEVLFDVAFKSG